MKIPQPFLPLRAETENNEHIVHVIGRDYTIGVDGMITSIRSQGVELLAAPMRLMLIEEGQPANWDENYAENESESFVQSRSDEKIVICGTKQSDRFIVATCWRIDYDGCVDIDLKLMTRGQTVSEVFGVAKTKPKYYKLNQLWIEIPLRAEAMTLFHMYPNSDLKLSDGTIRPESLMSTGGALPQISSAMPFKTLLWLGNEERGLGWFAENYRNWQPQNKDRAIELISNDDQIILRIRLLDSHPDAWLADPQKGMSMYQPLTFKFGLHATPVKPFPKQPYIHNAFHLDCGIKVKGNYIDVLAERYDELKEKGVTTLILHEKWNKCQNWFELSEFTMHQIKIIVDECHKRGIKVLPYFGYELSSIAPQWSELKDQVVVKNKDGSMVGGWWRVPFQRDYVVCYHSKYADLFVEGIARIMDECHIDGVYLDSTSFPRLCYSTEHGCGWYDRSGELHGSYNLHALRHLFKRLYDVVQSRGGEINVHSYGYINFTTIPYIHQNWLGENLQFTHIQGNTEDINLDYFRAEYLGRNMGVPVEFLTYANPPKWTFEHALSCSVLHGILPRPNDLNHPLDLMSRVWKVLAAFPIELSEWMPYWNNNAHSSHEKVKISYYRYTDLSGLPQLLAFVVNISSKPIENITVSFPENVVSMRDMLTGQDIDNSFSLEAYSCRILFVR
ncbi:MAG: glycoside hydrolase domain-containing protein [Christensenellales bacterium]|jgi:hypothetical protein